jgi:hypothetical protein
MDEKAPLFRELVLGYVVVTIDNKAISTLKPITTENSDGFATSIDFDTGLEAYLDTGQKVNDKYTIEED